MENQSSCVTSHHGTPVNVPDPGRNARVVCEFDCARDAAKTADDLLAYGEWWPSLGIATANQSVLQRIATTWNTKVRGNATGGRSHARGPGTTSVGVLGWFGRSVAPPLDVETTHSLDHGIYAFRVDNGTRPWGSSLRWTLLEPYSSRRSLYSA